MALSWAGHLGAGPWAGKVQKHTDCSIQRLVSESAEYG